MNTPKTYSLHRPRFHYGANTFSLQECDIVNQAETLSFAPPFLQKPGYLPADILMILRYTADVIYSEVTTHLKTGINLSPAQRLICWFVSRKLYSGITERGISGFWYFWFRPVSWFYIYLVGIKSSSDKRKIITETKLGKSSDFLS